MRTGPTSHLNRRSLLKTLLGWLMGLPLVTRAVAQTNGDEIRKARPQKGDGFVHAVGDRKGQLVRVVDLEIGGPQAICYAKEPYTGVVRDGSRLNQVVLVRLDPEGLAGATRAASAEGVVAYSAICPHTGCDVSMWRAGSGNLLCSCHDSEFDPRDGARVTTGPAPRRLPSLPLAVRDGVVEASGGFDARVRFQREF